MLTAAPANPVPPGLVPVNGSTDIVHTIPVMDPSDARIGASLFTLCGRLVTITAVYEPTAWARFVAQWVRIGRTHVTFTCANCAKRTTQTA